MEIQELRIGNYVKIFDTITQIEGMSTWDNLIQNSNFAERELSEFEPIELTEEWLLKFGFKKDGYGDFIISNAIMWLNNGKIIAHIGMSTAIDIKCNYVHELQNIYFSLKGQELKLNK